MLDLLLHLGLELFALLQELLLTLFDVLTESVRPVSDVKEIGILLVGEADLD